jgi:hypothetical protein
MFTTIGSTLFASCVNTSCIWRAITALELTSVGGLAIVDITTGLIADTTRVFAGFAVSPSATAGGAYAAPIPKSNDVDIGSALSMANRPVRFNDIMLLRSPRRENINALESLRR